MKKGILIFVLTVAALRSSGTAAHAQYRIGSLEADRQVHEFGDVLRSDGPLSCTFTLRNKGASPAVIHQVVTSCGCTSVSWTRSPIAPGATGTIKATYANDEGPYPFDKTLTVYVGDARRPGVLHLRGTVHDRKKPLAERYPVQFGPLGIKRNDLSGGNLEQGLSRSDEFRVANLGKSPIRVTFTDVSPGLTLRCESETLAPGAESRILYTLSADRSRWGRNWYYATPLVNGKSLVSNAPATRDVPDPHRIGIQAFTKENFSAWSKQEKDRAALPAFSNSTFSFGRVRAGTNVEATFSVRNKGQETWTVYKVDCDTPGVRWTLPETLPAGGSAEMKVSYDTSRSAAGENLVTLILTSNSPLRPMIYLFLAGWID